MEDTNPLANTLRWLEEEQNQNKSLIAKLQQQVEQLLALTGNQGEKLRVMEESLAAATSQLPRVAKLEEELRQAKENLGQLQVQLNRDKERLDTLGRSRQGEVEREHQVRSELEHRLDTIAQERDNNRSRLANLEEIARRYSETLLQVQQHLENLARQDETQEARVSRAVEQDRRQEQEVARLDAELVALRKQDEVALSRVQMAVDQMRRLEEQYTNLSAREDEARELRERIELQRTERERLERQLTELQNQVVELGQRLAAQIANFGQIQEQQKRRLMTELEHQARELRNLINLPTEA
ncbi:MAG: hypothetical protein HY664_07295 [Chloroflexi bacterium]|nr:hypothetical protein [Chloroflexota bacterium]